MEVLIYALLIIATMAHALWNYVLKKETGGQFMIGFSMIIVSVCFTPVMLSIFGKKIILVTSIQLLLIGLSVFLHLLYFLFLNLSYRYGELSTVYPITRTVAPMLTLILAVAMLSESIAQNEWWAIGFIIVGAFLISKPKKTVKAQSENSMKGVLFAMLCAITIALYSLVDKFIISGLNLSPVVYYYLLISGMAVVFMMIGLLKVDQMKVRIGINWRGALKIAMLSPISYLLILISMQSLNLGVVSMFRQLSIVFSFLLGIIFLREKANFYKKVGFVFSLAGVLALSLA